MVTLDFGLQEFFVKNLVTVSLICLTKVYGKEGRVLLSSKKIQPQLNYLTVYWMQRKQINYSNCSTYHTDNAQVFLIQKNETLVANII